MAGYVSDISFPSDDDVEIVDILRQGERRPRVRHQRPNFYDTYDDVNFVKHFHLSKASVLMLLNRIVDRLEFPSERNNSLSPINQLLLALRFYPTGSHLLSAGDFSGVSAPTACRVTPRVSESIALLNDEFIRFPQTPQEISTIQRDFYAIARFPRVVGAMDCTHVKIQSPGGDNAETFRKRKGYFSINVQTIVKPNLEISDIVTRWPGSVHDSTIFNNCGRRAEFVTGRYGSALLLGDGGYAIRPFLLTPFERPQTPADHRYNESQIRTRNSEERSYGIWKRRFPILALGMRVRVPKALAVTNASAVLHNVAIQNGDPQPPDVVADVQQIIDEGTMPTEAAVLGAIQTNANRIIQRAIIEDHFQRLV